MCGIVAQVGIVEKHSRQSRALSSMAHRGPDAEAKWYSPQGHVWLGHRRLSIVDLSSAAGQPMHNEDQTIWLVCNGEIYNCPCLRARLESLGHRFHSRSDNEVIIHAYEAWGDQCVVHLEGMFAFALWDEPRGHLLAARDRVGIKPLYYSETKQGLVLASEAGVVRELLEPRPGPEPVALAYVMTLGYIPSPWSIWKGIKKLEPAHLLNWDRSTGPKSTEYWEPPRHIDRSARSDRREEWQPLFERVLAEHLLSDVPVGLFLSGGLDSSSVAVGLHRISYPGHAITVSFPKSPQSETSIASALAGHLGLVHRCVELDVKSVASLIHSVASSFDEPLGYSALLSMYLVCQMAAQEFKVVLAGDGGDEVLGGYTWYLNVSQPLPVISPWVRRALRPVVRRNSSPAIQQIAANHFAQSSLLHRHAWRLYPRFLPEEAERLLAPMGLHFDDHKMLAPLRRHFEPALPLRRALQRVDLMTFCADAILAKVDKASMAHSLEVRVPFLDRRIIEWGLTQPIGEREEDESKPVLRDYLRSRVPDCVLAHPKRGFSLQVLKDFDWSDAIEQIRHGPWVRQGYWSADWEGLLQHGVLYRTARVWNLLMLTKWAEAHLESRESIWVNH